MKRVLLGSAAATMLYGSLALGADVPVKASPYNPGAPLFSWSGFYLGGHVGYDRNEPTARFGANFPQTDLPTLPFGTPFHPNGNGFLGGVQAGFNYQIRNLVFGVETDWSWLDVKGATRLTGSDPALGFPPGYTFSTAERLKSLGTLRGRVGFTPTDRLLVYGTGGLAYGKVEDSTSLNIAAGVIYAGSHSSLRPGWTAGGGAEYALAPNWTAKIEYLYYDLDPQSVTGIRTPPAPFFTRSGFDTTGHMVRVGLNYRFGGDPWGKSPVVARY
jgi:outer membrane immunogenic protein